MNRSSAYRRHVQDCIAMAELVTSEKIKSSLLGWAQSFHRLAHMAEETERFAQRIRKQIGVAVEMADERLTSWEAERVLEEEFGRKSKQIDGAPKKKDSEKFTVDSVAATIILRDYLQRSHNAHRRYAR